MDISFRRMLRSPTSITFEINWASVKLQFSGLASNMLRTYLAESMGDILAPFNTSTIVSILLFIVFKIRMSNINSKDSLNYLHKITYAKLAEQLEQI